MPDTEPQVAEIPELLAAGLTALLDGAWTEARDRFSEALALDPESPEALEGYAAACWWLDDIDTAIEARERAYTQRPARRRSRTARPQPWPPSWRWDHGALRGATAVATGWLERARRLTADLPPAPEHAWLSLIEASFHLDSDADAVLRLSTEALEHAQANGGFEAEMTARTLQGLALVSLGRVEEGTRLLDEGTAAVTGGELHDPLAIGSCCCNMIIACERVRDFDRAAQWCERLRAYSERTGQRPLLALCRAHHGTVLTMWGEWALAEEELAWASDELTTLRPPLAGFARTRLAELRRRQGRGGEAMDLLEAAGGHVLVPLVRAALAVDDDDPVSATAHLEAYLRGFGPEHPIETAAAFELLVIARIRLDQLDRAEAGHDQLAAIAATVGTDALRAAERAAAGALGTRAAGARPRPGRPGGGRRALRALPDAVRGRESRAQLARALAAEDRGNAALELAITASSAFDALGAKRAGRDADRLVGRLGGRRTAARRAGLTRREVEVLALVAKGLSNREIADRLFVSEHTVHRHLSNVYTRLGVASRAEAVAVAAERDLLT